MHLFLKGDTGYYSGGTDNCILAPETFSLSSFLSWSNEIRETKRNEKLKKKGWYLEEKRYHMCGHKAPYCAFFFFSFFFLSFPSSDQIRSERERILSFIAGDNMDAREGARGETGGG